LAREAALKHVQLQKENERLAESKEAEEVEHHRKLNQLKSDVEDLSEQLAKEQRLSASLHKAITKAEKARESEGAEFRKQLEGKHSELSELNE